MHWRMWLWLGSVVWLAVACVQGEPGAPWNHPVLVFLMGSAGFFLLAVSAWFLTGVARRWERRERRDERRD